MPRIVRAAPSPVWEKVGLAAPRLGIRRTVLVREAAVGIGAHHVDVGAGGDVGGLARAAFEIDGDRAGAVDHVMAVAGVFRKSGEIAGAQQRLVLILDQRQLPSST